MKEILQKARKERIIYGCSFCGRTNVRKATMVEHEKICYYNPDRSECPGCDGSGRNVEWSDDGAYKIVDDECPLCKTWREIHRIEDPTADWIAERQEMARG